MQAPLFIVDVQPIFNPPKHYLEVVAKAICLAREQGRFIIFLECGEEGCPSTMDILTNAAFGRPNSGFVDSFDPAWKNRYPKIGWIKKRNSLGWHEVANWFQTFLPECREVIVGGLYYANCVNWAAQGCLQANIVPTVCLDLCLGHGHMYPPPLSEYKDGRIQAASYKEVMNPSVALNNE